jgi:hypothetical protein
MHMRMHMLPWPVLRWRRTRRPGSPSLPAAWGDAHSARCHGSTTVTPSSASLVASELGKVRRVHCAEDAPAVHRCAPSSAPGALSRRLVAVLRAVASQCCETAQRECVQIPHIWCMTVEVRALAWVKSPWLGSCRAMWSGNAAGRATRQA